MEMLLEGVSSEVLPDGTLRPCWVLEEGETTLALVEEAACSGETMVVGSLEEEDSFLVELATLFLEKLSQRHPLLPRPPPRPLHLPHARHRNNRNPLQHQRCLH
jgi:hypothetical protein